MDISPLSSHSQNSLMSLLLFRAIIRLPLFRQLSANSGTYRDAVEFKNGVTLSLQSLQEGQSVEVVALSLENTGVQEGMLLAADAQFPARA
jgi:hypothetical protein